MANNTVKLTFEVGDNGTLRVVDEIGRKVEDLGKTADGVSTRAEKAFTAVKTAAAATAAAIGTAAAATAYAVKGQIDQLDDITKLARNIGISTRELSGLSVTADLAGVSIEQLGRGVVFLSRKIEEARSGGSGGDVFKRLGIDVSAGRSATEVLYDVSDAFAQMQDGAGKTATAVEIFGRSGVGFVTLLSAGSEALREQAREAQTLGLVFDELSGKLAEELNDDLTRLGLAVTGLSRELAVALLPVIEQQLDATTDWVIANRELLAQDLAGWLRSVADAASMTASALSAAGSVAQTAYTYLVEPVLDAGIELGVNAYYNPGFSTIAEQAKRRAYSRGLDPSRLGNGRAGSAGMSPMFPGSSEADLAGVSGSFAATSALADALGGRGGTRTGAPSVASGAAAAKVEVDALAKTIEEDLLFTLGRIEQGTVLDEYFQELPAVAEEASVQIADNFVQEIERAEVAVIDLGDLLGDSLTSAVDNLIASGKFNLADVFVATGRTVVSRMVSGVLQETLQFPTIPTDITSLFRSSAGASRVAQAGTVTGGSYGAGMSFDASQYSGMTDAATGAAVIVPSATATSSTPGLGQFIGAGLGGLALGSSLAGIFGKTDDENLISGGVGGVGGAVAGGLAFGPVGALIGGLIGSLGGGFLGDLFKSKPNKDQETRMALDEAFKAGGIFPTLALAKEPPREFRPGTSPGFQGAFSGDIEALAVMLGLEGSQVDEKAFRALGNRASILGVDSTQFQRELQAVAQSATTLPDALRELNFSFLRNSIDGKDAEFTLDQYNKRLESTINLLVSDLPVGVDAVAIAFENMDRYAENSVVNIEEYARALEQAAAVASGLQSGLRGAGTSAVSGLLTGQAGVAGGFRRGVLNSAVGALGESALNSIVGSGAFGELNKSLTAALLKGDAAGIESALALVPSAFDQVNAAVARFIPIFRELSEEIETGSRTAADYMGQRSDVLALRDRISMSGMTQSAQRSTLQARLSTRLADLAGLTEDGQIIGAEQGKLDKLLPLITGDAEALARIADTYATGSRQGRDLRMLAQSALDTAASALEIAASSVTVGDMSVSTMTVDQIIVSANAAAAITVAGLNTPQGQQSARQSVQG